MDLNYIISRIKNEDDIPLIEKAYYFALEKLTGLYHDEGETLIDWALKVTNTLIDFNADSLTLVSGILYETLNHGVGREVIEKEFGSDVLEIALGAAKISVLDNETRAEYLNELEAESDLDVRSLFIILGKRLYHMQTMQSLSDSHQKDVAKDALDILVPTAHRLKLHYIASRIEDISLFYLEPEAYNDILKRLGDAPDKLRVYLDKMKIDISTLLTDHNINHQIKGRVKTVYSIYNKLSRGKNWEDIYDILAIRVLVDDVDDCNEVIDLIHSKYRPVPSRFKDYIKDPKENMYQSLHTTITGEGNKSYEVQVRTYEMNKTAEDGSAAHTLYKEKSRIRKRLV